MLPQVLLGKLKQMEVNPYIIKWYHSFLVDRQQQVKVNSTLSELQTISGEPLRGVLARLSSLHCTQMTAEIKMRIITSLNFQMTLSYSVYWKRGAMRASTKLKLKSLLSGVIHIICYSM
ncbi:hypothetical protein LDENG_00214830 [Lucifuga dentata]|nr:hypothetical protein LDENG_00214830 [Lucifuga dentata]